MPLKPYDLASTNVQIPDELNDILIQAGVSPAKQSSTPTVNRARDVFNQKGASLDKAADTISRIMDFGETDAGRLKASELVLKVHGILNELDEKSAPSIVINVSNQFTQENKTLINLVVPTV